MTEEHLEKYRELEKGTSPKASPSTSLPASKPRRHDVAINVKSEKPKPDPVYIIDKLKDDKTQVSSNSLHVTSNGKRK